VAAISPDRIAAILRRQEEVQAQMARADLAPEEFVRLSKDYAELEPVAKAASEVEGLRGELAELEAMLGDPEMKAMAQEELEAVRARLPEAEHKLAIALLPKDAADARPAMLEIRAGTGGDEAALFAGDLFRMYQRYAETQGWRVELISANASEAGGYKEGIASVTGAGVVAQLQFESGGPPGPGGPGTGRGRAHPHLGGDRGGAAGGRGCRRADQ